MTKQKVTFEGFSRKNGEKFNHTFFFLSLSLASCLALGRPDSLSEVPCSHVSLFS